VSTGASTADRSGRPSLAGLPTFRVAAGLSLIALTASYGSVLYRVTDIVGGAELVVATVVGAAALAVAAGRLLRVRTALLLTALLLAGGGAVYLLSVPENQRALISAERVLADAVALLTGLSVLRLTQAHVWAMSVAPGPVFLSWYLAVRRRYAWSVAVGGAALVLFVLTGDAGGITTLVGVVGGAGVVGFGTLDRYGGADTQVDTLVVLFVVMVVAAATLPALPVSRASPVLPDGGQSGGVAGLADATDRMELGGSIQLTTQVQFTVESDASTYWTTATYDRYTGSGWVRTGDTAPYVGRLRGPPGDRQALRQEITAETELGAIPAAWQPTEIEGLATSRVRVTPQGTFRPTTTLDPGESYTVTSQLSRPNASTLRAAGTDYPAGLREQYTQLPASTPERVRERAATVTENASTPYDAAVAVESHLESTIDYSLTVDRPRGDIADAFLFEMDGGYCTYFATTMVAMLRSEGVPARLVTGYTAGEQVSEDVRVVRGLDSHAWVQVYVPDVGWVRFDPTPAEPRRAAEESQLADDSAGDVDFDVEGTTTPTPAQSDDADAANGASSTPTPTGTGADALGDSGGGGSGGWPIPVGVPSLPSREVLALMGVALVGVGAALRLTGAGRRALDAVWLRRRGPRRDPDADARRAFERLVYLLERQERPRRPGETPRAFVERVTSDERAERVLSAYERARYGGGVDREDAAAATDAVGELVRERTLPTRPFVR
jgi:transglutaminase-like putative cysteine protease